jgi:hypothetical protein
MFFFTHLPFFWAGWLPPVPVVCYSTVFTKKVATLHVKGKIYFQNVSRGYPISSDKWIRWLSTPPWQKTEDS